MQTPDRYRRWFEYEKDAHAKTIASLEAAEPDLHDTPEFNKAVTLLAHLSAARQLWLFRFGIYQEPPRQFFPQDLQLAEVRRELEMIQRHWETYFNRLDDAELNRSFDYYSLDGPRFRNTIEDILTQLFGHSLYHRGQIALLLRSIGAEPAVTDFVFWTREAL